MVKNKGASSSHEPRSMAAGPTRPPPAEPRHTPRASQAREERTAAAERRMEMASVSSSSRRTAKVRRRTRAARPDVGSGRLGAFSGATPPWPTAAHPHPLRRSPPVPRRVCSGDAHARQRTARGLLLRRRQPAMPYPRQAQEKSMDWLR